MLTSEEVETIDLWRFENRMPSRSAAVRALMDLGISSPVALADHQAAGRAAYSASVGISKPGCRQSRKAMPPILVVEGDFLVSTGIRARLERAGFQAVGPVKTMHEVAEALVAGPIAAVIIDVQADAEVAVACTDLLASAKVPFVLCVRADPKSCLPESLWSAPMVRQTLAEDILVHTVSDLVAAEPLARPYQYSLGLNT